MRTLSDKNLITSDVTGAANTTSLQNSTFSHTYITATDFPEEQNGWVLTYSDICDAAKKNCKQANQLLMTSDSGKSYKNIMPKGTTQKLNLGESAVDTGVKAWDQCDAPTLSQAGSVVNQFDFAAVGLYIGGVNY